MPRISISRVSVFTVLAIFATIYCLISLVNHYYFRTYTLDLGFFSNALYDYRNLRWNYSLTISEQPSNMLGGHFEPMLILLAPFSFLFGSYTLLIIQIAFVLWGGVSVYAYFKESNRFVAIMAMIFFLGYFSVLAALAFDFHTNVIAASCFPFLLLSLKRNRIYSFIAVYVFMLLCKENISLWLIFICLALAFEQRKNPIWRKRLLVLSGVAVCYFAVVIYGVIPAFSDKPYTGFLYEALGSTPGEAIVFMVSHPLQVLKLLFTNTFGDPYFDGYKQEFHRLVLFTGLPFLLFRPAYFFMLVPLYFQKMLHNQPALWGIGFHYGIEFAPVMAIGVFEVISRFKKQGLQLAVSAVMTITGLYITYQTTVSSVSYTDKQKIRFYEKWHYEKDYDVKGVHKLLDEIPQDAIIAAQSPYLPHLAYRDRIYQFPMVNDAEYIIYSYKESSYPLTDSVFCATTVNFAQGPDWGIWREYQDFYVLKRVR